MILSFLVFISMLLAVLGNYRNRLLLYAFKPLTVVLIILYVLTATVKSQWYADLIVIGLIFSLIGDVFLMLPQDRFVFGLIAFLVAHLIYILALYFHVVYFDYWLLIPLIAYGVGIFIYLYAKLAEFKLPVIIYVCVILIMIWFAACWWFDGGPLAILVGALLFGLSDTVLAIDRFRYTFNSAQAIILMTYFIAQYLIATSVMI
ncbi:lysoplasmalogenase [Thiotrichales bacterium 19S3-7]|nr:lysoplasmalogenase [Thiotrichales bacterium 19S3-7]MCF6802935.1 lysoplasmalogenase [Thiotrichales bacterium 19S3-11]